MRITLVYWVLAVIFLSLALLVPRLRAVGIAGCVVLGLMLGWGVLERLRSNDPAQERSSPSAPTAAVSIFPLQSIKAEDMRVAGNGAPFELRGRITNLSADMLMRSFTAQIARRDCYEGALDPSGCVTLWTSRQWVELVVAPGESRQFVSNFWIRGAVPRAARGTVQDEINVVAADGRPVATGVHPQD